MIRKARIADVAGIQKMLAHFAQKGKLLARSLSELYTNVRDMFVFEDGVSGRVVGCCSLHVIWDNLAEIRSLAVEDAHQGRGVGRRLVEACMEEARELGISRLFTLTYEAVFFERLGFKVVDKNVFPQKIWADCLHCPKFPDCDEVALVFDLQESAEVPEGEGTALRASKPPTRKTRSRTRSRKRTEAGEKVGC